MQYQEKKSIQKKLSKSISRGKYAAYEIGAFIRQQNVQCMLSVVCII